MKKPIMTCQTRRLWSIGSWVLMALLSGEMPGTLAGAADPTIPSGESEAYQSLPPEKKRSLAQGMATDQPGEVESRGMPQLQRPMMPGNPVQPSAPGQPTAQVPTWPQKFDIQGPESDSFGFAVTQPGPIVVDVQSQGAPVAVTLQGAAPQPISQQGAFGLRLTTWSSTVRRPAAARSAATIRRSSPRSSPSWASPRKKPRRSLASC